MSVSAYQPPLSPLPGLTLKAWGLFAGATGGLVRGFNVSGVVRSTLGTYTFTLSSAVTNSGNCFMTVQENHQGGTAHGFNAGAFLNTTTAGSIWTFGSGGAADFGLIYFAVYE